MSRFTDPRALARFRRPFGVGFHELPAHRDLRLACAALAIAGVFCLGFWSAIIFLAWRGA